MLLTRYREPHGSGLLGRARAGSAGDGGERTDVTGSTEARCGWPHRGVQIRPGLQVEQRELVGLGLGFGVAAVPVGHGAGEVFGAAEFGGDLAPVVAVVAQLPRPLVQLFVGLHAGRPLDDRGRSRPSTRELPRP
ncbi:hypothetical protein RHRU231_670035 [Rhodococcus ruber]|uniref:Uncharacterized protein n=1 Tax=Rhodococcus ruber TaxID=1830 RepID=A0A098BR78_9NOCA|nr:hypothetical protein RHRU231_670035 [Rhodococcus ruber]